MKRTQYVKCRCGTESEDGLPFVKYYKGLQRQKRDKEKKQEGIVSKALPQRFPLVPLQVKNQDEPGDGCKWQTAGGRNSSAAVSSSPAVSGAELLFLYPLLRLPSVLTSSVSASASKKRVSAHAGHEHRWPP